MVLTILQWNARSLIANGLEFKHFIDQLDEKPHIICIQETWLKSHLDFVIQGYGVVRKDRKVGNGGGVATFIQNQVQYRVINEFEEYEVVAIDIYAEKQNIQVINFYNPCDRLNKGLEKVIGSRSGYKVIWCGDFNAHNTLWGSINDDHNGEVIEEIIDSHALVCLNDGRNTRIDLVRGIGSAIDLTLVSEELARRCEWDVCEDNSMGSDHYIIICKVGMSVLEQNLKPAPGWRFKKANWEAYSFLSEVGLTAIEPESMEEVDEFNDRICKVLYDVADTVIGRKGQSRKRKSVPWWTEQCSKAVQDRNKAFRQIKRTYLFEDFIKYKKTQAEVRRTVRAAKKKYWRDWCSTIGDDVDISEVWGTIRKMGGIYRSQTLPVLKNDEGIIAVTDNEKAEMLAKVFVRVHSDDNVSEEAKRLREQNKNQHPDVMIKRNPSGDALDTDFTLYELKRALGGVKHTSPGKDYVCYIMIKHLTDRSLNMILCLFNRIWNEGKLPPSWKHGIIVPIGKPGKDKSNPTGYRPIALTSNLCKLMEKLIIYRLNYVLESKGLMSPYQSGFREGRNTMDAVLSLEADIRKAQVNKEVLVGVLFDIEKAYDMLWKEGLLIKLKCMGIGGKMYNWIMDFLLERTIQVRVGVEYSKTYKIDNGTPQGSVCSPVLFNIMINDVFNNLKGDIGRALFADDGAIWKRGRNIICVSKKLQESVEAVEDWANNWGFRLSVAKTQGICFTKKKRIPVVKLKLYKQDLEQVSAVKYLGVWMDQRLTFATHAKKLIEKCKTGVNILRCLSGVEWGACRISLKRIYCTLIRSSLDYGSIIYGFASETLLKKIETIQSQALRICCGAFKTSPIAALQVELGEAPLYLRRYKLRMNYWVNIKGHKENHSVKGVMKECWEHGNKTIKSFGWTANREALEAGIDGLEVCPIVSVSNIPPWIFPKPLVDFQIQTQINNDKDIPKNIIAQQYIDQSYTSWLHIYTDGSKDPASGRTASAVHIPKFQCDISKRLTDNVSVYTAELIAILVALHWVEDVKPRLAVICSDSYAALSSLASGLKSTRQDIIYDILASLLRNSNTSLIMFLWVPAHVGVEANEVADKLAKQALNHADVDIQVALSKKEVQAKVKEVTHSKWQEAWDVDSKGRHLNSIQQLVGNGRSVYKNRKEDIIISRLRIGHSGLNYSLFKIGKHATGKCRNCDELETIEHILFSCQQYENERILLIQEMEKLDINTYNIQSFLECNFEQWKKYRAIIKFIKDIGLYGII